MSTPNFAIPTASRYYAFGMNKYMDQYCIDANDFPQDWLGLYDEMQTQISYDDAILNVKNELESKGWWEIDECDNNRSYPSHYFARIRKSFTICGADITITVDAGNTGAYYEGSTFDYRASLEVCPRYEYGCEYDLTGDYAVSADDCIRDNWTGNHGFSKIQSKNIVRRIYRELEEITNQAEDTFSKFCEHELLCGGIFSNGEAIYGPADNPRWQLKAAVVA